MLRSWCCIDQLSYSHHVKKILRWKIYFIHFGLLRFIQWQILKFRLFNSNSHFVPWDGFLMTSWSHQAPTDWLTVDDWLSAGAAGPGRAVGGTRAGGRRWFSLAGRSSRSSTPSWGQDHSHRPPVFLVPGSSGNFMWNSPIVMIKVRLRGEGKD